MNRGDVYWVEFGGKVGRRPALIVGRSTSARPRVTVAPITRTVHGLRSEVPVGPDEGLPAASVALCSDLVTIPRAVMSRRPAGSLGRERIVDLDRALVFALGIRLPPVS